MQSLMFLMFSAILGMGTINSNDSDKILGQWTDEDQTRILEFVKNGDVYEAIIIEADPASYIGKKQITSLKFHKKNVYKDGTLHILKKDRTATCSAKLISDTEMKLKVSIGMMSKSAVWTKL